ncbi:MAG: putative lipid II flippase FtsW [Gammaproteobacteria bacterium]|nr:putative lipid II flippase FtsW [Gammaproteobacteria bacterium]NND39075.1 putative lipid II flippase FtsW [Pseudomonadales bacterium]RZV51570.1 MAG: putative lipid II flippase FtsW [Pseudomonadales bacterium]
MRTQVKSDGLPSLSTSNSLRIFGLDGWLLFAVGALLAIGLVMITSASLDYAGRRHGNALFYFYRHSIYLVIAACAALLCVRVPVSTWRRYAVHMLIASFGLLVLILIPGLGYTANNATRWLALGPFTLQVSELAKLGVVFYLASYLVRQERLVRSHVLGFFNPMLVMMLLVVLLLLQPDFGAVVVMLGAALGLLFLGGVRLWQFGILIAASAAAIALMVLTEEYRMARFVAFLDPWSYQQGSGYQLIQSLIAFGRGEFFGLGLGNSIQKLFFLPEAHTDFIFAVLAEELGMAGCAVVLALFGLLISRLLLIAQSAQAAGEDFGAYVVYGIALIFAIQCFINVGVNIGLLPTKGLTLPFLSYGGSSLLVSCVSVAVALRIEREIYVHALDDAQRRGGQPVSRSLRQLQSGVVAHA